MKVQQHLLHYRFRVRFWTGTRQDRFLWFLAAVSGYLLFNRYTALGGACCLLGLLLCCAVVGLPVRLHFTHHWIPCRFIFNYLLRVFRGNTFLFSSILLLCFLFRYLFSFYILHSRTGVEALYFFYFPATSFRCLPGATSESPTTSRQFCQYRGTYIHHHYTITTTTTATALLCCVLSCLVPASIF